MSEHAEYVTPARVAGIDWRDSVPPCDHEHVAALLRREGVE